MEYYEVLNQLAQGGQGTTMRVKRKVDGSVLVLKQSFCDNAKAGNSALREAKTLQSLEHPYIVRYEDVFLTEDGRQLVVCLVMAYMEGGDLAHYMIALKKHGMSPEPNRVVAWSKQLAGSIAYLHSNKIVHRDLKPQNVFMQDDNTLKIGDFGLAQTIERGKRTSHVGTPCYMAPEVLQKDAYADAVDVWGIGCILMEAVTMEFLWERKGMLAGQVLSEPVRAASLPAQYPMQLREAIAACLLAKPEARPAAAMVLDALENSKKQEPNAMQEINQFFGSFQANATKAFSNLWLGGIQEESDKPEHAILSMAPPSRFLLPQTGADNRRTQLEEAARRDAAAPAQPPTPEDVSPPARNRPPGQGLGLSPEEVGGLVGGIGGLPRPTNLGFAAGGGTPGASPTSAAGRPASLRQSPTDSVRGTPSSVGFGQGGGGTPQAAGAAAGSPYGQADASTRGTPTALYAGGGGEAPQWGDDRGGMRMAAGAHQQQQLQQQSQPQQQQQPEVPPEVIEQYRRSGLFAVDAQWRAPLQALMQQTQAKQQQAALSRQGSIGAGGAAMPASLSKKGSGGAGFMRSLAASISGNSPSSDMQRSFQLQQALHNGTIDSMTSPPGPPASVGGSRGGKKRDEVAPGQVVEMSPSQRVAWQGGDRNKTEVVRIVRKGQKEYELRFESDNWEAARSSSGDGRDEAVQEMYMKMFGPPAKRYIGTVERLTAV